MIIFYICDMNKTERHQFILTEVHLHNRVVLADLANMLNVSIDTVRRDIKELDSAKKLKKVHGGALSNGFNAYSDRSTDIYELDSKVSIAQKAVSLIKEGDVVLISGGSTHLELVKLIPKKLSLTFFTPSLSMAIELSQRLPIYHEIFLIGGKLSRSSQLTIGGGSINLLSEIEADICFLGTGYLDAKKGITEVDWEIAQMKKAMIKTSKKVVSLCISPKLNTSNRYKICDIGNLDTLITELDPNSSVLDAYRIRSLKLL